VVAFLVDRAIWLARRRTLTAYSIRQ